MAADMAIPDGITPYVGFRVWAYSWGYVYEDDVPTKHHNQRGILRAITTASKWSTSGVTEAVCNPAVFMQRQKQVGACEGPAPNPDCVHGCGLHAFHTVAELRKNYKQSAHFHTPLRVMGAVLGWGEMIRHKDQGWRAQYAKPIALMVPERRHGANAAPMLKRFYREIDEVMEELGAVRCHDYRDLELFGFENGARWLDSPILP